MHHLPAVTIYNKGSAGGRGTVWAGMGGMVRRGEGGTEIARGLERMPIDFQRGIQCNKELHFLAPVCVR